MNSAEIKTKISELQAEINRQLVQIEELERNLKESSIKTFEVTFRIKTNENDWYNGADEENFAEHLNNNMDLSIMCEGLALTDPDDNIALLYVREV